MTEQTLYERIGGDAALSAAVNIFYKRVLNDKELAPFFENTDINKQVGKQKIFLSYAFGGLPNYDGRSMSKAHEKARSEGLNEHHFNLVAGHLVDTLNELNVAPNLIDEVITIVLTTKEDVLFGQAA